VVQRFENPESKHVGGNLGLSKSQIEWSNGLEILSPNTSGVIWGLEIIQISNQVIQRFGNSESKHVGGNLGFGDYPNLKLGGPIVWKS
jgi:hypothetical protein